MRCNHMGSGFAYKKNGESKIYLSKAFFNIDAFITAIKDSNLTEDDELIIHHRIATSGTDAKRNTHPFIVTSDFDEMTKTEALTDKPVMAHNGMFSNYSDKVDKTFNDTAHWIQIWPANPYFLEMIKNHTQKFIDEYGIFSSLWSNKLAFLFPDRDLLTIGNFIEDKGYLHSNGGYCTIVHDRGGSSSNYSRNQKRIGFNNSMYGEDDEESNHLKLVHVNHNFDFLETQECWEKYGIKLVYSTSSEGGRTANKIPFYFVNNSFLNLDEYSLDFYRFKKERAEGHSYEFKSCDNTFVYITQIANPTTSRGLFLTDLKKWNIRIVKSEYVRLILDIFSLKKMYGLKISNKRFKKLESWHRISKQKKREMIKVKKEKKMPILIRTQALGYYLDQVALDKGELILEH